VELARDGSHGIGLALVELRLHRGMSSRERCRTLRTEAQSWQTRQVLHSGSPASYPEELGITSKELVGMHRRFEVVSGAQTQVDRGDGARIFRPNGHPEGLLLPHDAVVVHADSGLPLHAFSVLRMPVMSPTVRDAGLHVESSMLAPSWYEQFASGGGEPHGR
jgi:hypothetical protein